MAEQSLKDKTAKGLFWGGVSNGVQQLLGMLFGIYLARILNAEDYGLVGMLAIFSGIASTIINSGFTVALTNKQEATHRDYNAVFWFTFFASSILYFILFCFAPLIARFYDRPELVQLSRIIFVGFFFSGIGMVPYAVMFKQLMVKEQAKIDIVAMLMSGIVGLTCALKGYAYWALAWQSLVYVASGSILRCYYAPWRPTLKFDLHPLKEMFPFSIKLLFTNIFQQVNNNVFSVLLGRFYSASQLGFFSQGQKWMGMGNLLISGMIQQVVQPVLVQVGDDLNRKLNVFRKLQRFVAFVAFPAFLGLAFIAEDFIIVTIGDKWLPSVIFLRILSIWGIAYVFMTLYTQLIVERGASDIYLKGFILTGLSQLLVVLCMLNWGAVWMTIAYVIVYYVTLFYWFYYVHRFIRIKLLDIFKDIFPYMGITLISIGVATLLASFVENVYFSLVLKILLTAFLYILICYLSDSQIVRETMIFLRNTFK